MADLPKPVAQVQRMGSYQGVPAYGCLLTIEAEKRLKVNDPLFSLAELDAYAAAKVAEAVAAERSRISEGELWSWVRSVMSQGADIRCDYDAGKHKGYEAYSMRLDVAAIERAEELAAGLKLNVIRNTEAASRGET